MPTTSIGPHVLASRTSMGSDDAGCWRSFVAGSASPVKNRLSIGNTDDRIGTDECIALYQKLVAASRRANPDRKVLPVELIVGPSFGHTAIDDAYSLQTEFLLRQIR